MLDITEINAFNQFKELRDDWNNVLWKSEDNNIFLTWEYLSTYWKHFGNKMKPRILCIRQKDEIIAIAPLRQSRYSFVNPLGYNVIEPLGYRGLIPEGGDYTGLLLGERETECLKLFVEYLEEHDNWDFIYMYDVPETSPIPYLLQKIYALPPKFDIRRGAVCPYISLPKTVDALFKDFTKKFRNNLRRSMRNLEKDYGKIQMKKYNEFCSVEEAMKILFKLNQERWKSRSRRGTFGTQQIRDFYVDVARSLADSGWLALYFLTVKDEPVAGLYCFEYNKKMLAAVIGFDPDYFRYSVGNILFLKVIEKCIERRLGEFDFMKGDEPYKFGWTQEFRRNVSIKFVNTRITSCIYDWGIRTLKQIGMDRVRGKTLHLQVENH